MKLSAKTDYALKLVLYIATNPNVTSAKEIVENSGVPKSLGLRIITELVHGKVLKSMSGKNGGVFLNNSPEKISLYDVISLMEDLIIKECINNMGRCICLEDSNPLCRKMSELKENFISSLKSITFNQFLEGEKK